MANDRLAYRTSLRVIGRLLNGEKARMVTVCEIEHGFLLHYFVGGDAQLVASRAIHHAQVLEMDDALRKQRGQMEAAGALRGIRGLLRWNQGDALRLQKSNPLCAMGYEELLRSVGDAIDRRGAQSFAFSELDDRVVVEYTVDRADFVVRQGQRMALAGRRQEVYTGPQLVELVCKARDGAIARVRESGVQLGHNPLDLPSYLSAAAELEDHGQYDEAEDLYRRAFQLAPRQLDIHYRLALLARRRGDHKGALKLLDAALSYEALDGRLHHLRGRILLERNQPREAAEALQRAVVCAPGDCVIAYHLERAYEKLGHLPANERMGHAPAERRSRSSDAAQRTDRSAPAPATVGAASEAFFGAGEPALVGVSPTAPAPMVAAGPELSVPTPKPLERPAAPSAPARRLDQRIAARYEADKGMPELAIVPAGRPAVVAGASEAGGAVPTVPARVLEERQEEWLTARSVSSSPVRELPRTATPAATDWATPTLPVRSLYEGHGRAGETGGSAGNAPDSGFAGLVAKAEPLIVSQAEEAARLAASIARAQEMVNAEPHRADLHRKLGFLLSKQGRSEEAAAEFRRAVECGRRRMAS